MLSFGKLEKLLANNALLIKRVFGVKDMAVYIEILSLASASTFLIYIPSKYDIKAPRGIDFYEMHVLEIEDLDSIADDYGQPRDNIDLEMAYEEVDLENRKSGGDFVKHLEESYKRPVQLRDITLADTKELKEICRQTNRIKFCVNNLKYKLAILYKTFISVVRRDDSVRCYFIEGLRKLAVRQLFVVVDLETLFSKSESIVSDVQSVITGVHRVLEKNQISHGKIMRAMLDARDEAAGLADNIYYKKASYTEYIKQFETILEQLTERERNLYEQLCALRDGSGGNGSGRVGMTQDIITSRQTGKIEEEMSSIEAMKKDAMKNISKLSAKRDDVGLYIDKLMFDNSVMMDAIKRNIEKARCYIE